MALCDDLGRAASEWRQVGCAGNGSRQTHPMERRHGARRSGHRVRRSRGFSFCAKMGGEGDFARVTTGYPILSAPPGELPVGQGVAGNVQLKRSSTFNVWRSWMGTVVGLRI